MCRLETQFTWKHVDVNNCISARSIVDDHVNANKLKMELFLNSSRQLEQFLFVRFNDGIFNFTFSHLKTLAHHAGIYRNIKHS